jgi:hypothetical protein
LNIPEKYIEDEEVDGPKLLAMLLNEHLTDTTVTFMLDYDDRRTGAFSTRVATSDRA